MAETSFKIPFSRPVNAYGLPENFHFLRVLGIGEFGNVFECLNKDTNKIVAVKVPKLFWPWNEGPLMERLMRLNLDQKNIVQFQGWFDTFTGRALVFEPLAISLWDFMRQRDWAPMLLSDIRDIIRQLATALHALKQIGVIHTDLMLDNVMIAVNDGSRPLRIKLVEFGMAINQSSIKQGKYRQSHEAPRAPEIILGLPITEAIDIWSLGCLTAFLLRGWGLFWGPEDFDLLHQMCDLMGQPKDHLLDDGVKTEEYFVKTDGKRWKIKSYDDTFFGEPYYPPSGLTLDDMKKVRLEEENRLEAVQRGQCINLLERMLCLNWEKRITPSEILNHPFIRSDIEGTTHHPTIPPGEILVRPADPENRQQLDTDEEISEEAPVALKATKTGSSPPSPTTIPPGVILVHPADPKNRQQLDTDEEISEEAPVALKAIKTGSSPPPPTTIPPGVILVRPAAPKNRLQLDTDEEISEEAPVALKAIKTGSSPPPPTTIPPGVILVRPADPENRQQLDTDEEISEEAPVALKAIKTGSSPPPPTTIPPGVILVRPAAPKNRLQLDTDEEISEEAPVALKAIKTESSPPSPATIPPGVILVRPADPENRLQLDTDEEIRLPARLDSDTTSEGHDGAETQIKTAKKKKKNCFRRFFSWLKRNSIKPDDQDGH